MKKTLIDGFRDRQFDRYSDAFNFFLTKPINLILSGRCIDFVITFKDLEIYTEELDYLKRYYNQHEVEPRIDKLTQFYEVSIPRPMSNLIPTECYPILQKRERRLIKMMIKREKEQEEHKWNDDETDKRAPQLLQDLDADMNSDEDDSPPNLKSYDSSIHDIYEENEPQNVKYPNILDYYAMRKSPLVLDFKVEKVEKQQPVIPNPTTPANRIPQQYENQYVPKRQQKSARKSFMQYYYSISPKKTNILNSLYKL